MKRLLIALAIVFGLCLQIAAAQTVAPQAVPEKPKTEVAEKVQAELANIDKELELTPDQKATIKTILTDEIDKLQVVYKEIEPRTQAIRDESRSKMRAVLTPEQLTKWEKMKAERGKKLESKVEVK